ILSERWRPVGGQMSMAQSLRQPDLQPISTDRKTECFRLYTPDRKPGVNCVPDGSTGH
ncbi:hypothetical protein ACX3VG_16300, partial [Escherichia coli]